MEFVPSVVLVVVLVHEYTAERVPSLRSVPEAEHVSSSVTVAEEGEILTLPIVGLVFCTVAVAVVESLPPYPSSTVAVQVMVSETDAMDGVRVSAAELPTTFPEMLHS